MFKIVRKKELNSAVTLLEIEAPFIAKKAKAGQFIIFRIDEQGERVPLTIAGYDREKGTVTIIFQKVGFSTIALGNLNEGDYIRDFVGPLGKPTPVEGKKKVCVVGGGVGCAIALPSAAAFKEAGAEVTVIVGFRTRSFRTGSLRGTWTRGSENSRSFLCHAFILIIKMKFPMKLFNHFV